jgi:hypothetical protein
VDVVPGPKPFDRWRGPARYTTPLRVFRAHHTELNRLFWALAPAISSAVRIGNSAPPGGATATVFGVTGDAVHRVPSPVSDWSKTFADSETWIRLSALMALASYLEVYLVSAIREALESDPGLLIGAPGAVDGGQLQKAKGDQYSD